jgi:hypothetical protein
MSSLNGLAYRIGTGTTAMKRITVTSSFIGKLTDHGGEGEGGGVRGYSALPHPLLQQASGQIDIKRRRKGFSSNSHICFMVTAVPSASQILAID